MKLLFKNAFLFFVTAMLSFSCLSEHKEDEVQEFNPPIVGELNLPVSLRSGEIVELTSQQMNDLIESRYGSAAFTIEEKMDLFGRMLNDASKSEIKSRGEYDSYLLLAQLYVDGKYYSETEEWSSGFWNAVILRKSFGRSIRSAYSSIDAFVNGRRIRSEQDSWSYFNCYNSGDVNVESFCYLNPVGEVDVYTRLGIDCR